MNHKCIDINGIKTRVCKWGDKNKPTILALHGLGSTALSFIEIAELLKEDYHFVAVDLLGHGKSGKFDDRNYNIERLTNWLDSVVDLICSEKIYLMGHSLGAWISLHYAYKHTEKIKKVLLLDGGYHISKEIHDYYSNFSDDKIKNSMSKSLEEEIRQSNLYYDSYTFKNYDECVKDAKEKSFRWSDFLSIATMDMMKDDNGVIKFCSDKKSLENYLVSMFNYTLVSFYSDFDFPILLLHATLPNVKHWDIIRSRMVDNFKNKTKAKVKPMVATHSLHWDDPVTVVDEIREWFS